MLIAAKVEIPVRFLHFLPGDVDIIQRDTHRRMPEHLAEQKELSRIVPAHQHLMITES